VIRDRSGRRGDQCARQLGAHPGYDGGAEGAQVFLPQHDPSRTPDPDRYDLHRPRRAILAFGAGVHVCPGKAWMLMLLEEAARALAARRLRLAVAPGQVARQDGGLMPGVPGRIPVRPAAARKPSGLGRSVA
jgi:hypothetical protein